MRTSLVPTSCTRASQLVSSKHKFAPGDIAIKKKNGTEGRPVYVYGDISSYSISRKRIQMDFGQNGHLSKDVLWQLTAAAYGLADSGRLWYLRSDNALTEIFGLTRSKYEPNLYYWKYLHGLLNFILVTQVDNYVYAGTHQGIEGFEALLQMEFDISEHKKSNFELFGCEVLQKKSFQLP